MDWAPNGKDGPLCEGGPLPSLCPGRLESQACLSCLFPSFPLKGNEAMAKGTAKGRSGGRAGHLTGHFYTKKPNPTPGPALGLPGLWTPPMQLTPRQTLQAWRPTRGPRRVLQGCPRLP